MGDGIEVAVSQTYNSGGEEEYNAVAGLAQQDHAGNIDQEGRVGDEVGPPEVHQAAGEGPGEDDGDGIHDKIIAGSPDEVDGFGVEGDEGQDAGVGEA